ncbi:LysE family translocator [Leifsonia shinshuensis]|uniref:LysE family translocator n=1 Tax=Leifsonia TaxID=110932 RepID=UPI0028655316|nr:LysE family translocator [Leifsonia shinshuensis]MDR6971101.1 threonine/homoserine/homoserine lactone efflux protein [Leifsonia shinshuensis]
MATTAILGFWGVAALLVLTPGADWAYAIAAGAGRRAVSSVAGILSGYALVVVAVAVGVGALVAASPVLLGVLTVGGALYLVWIGLNGLLRRSVPLAEVTSRAGSPWASFLRGAGVSGFNPKGLLVLVALVPQFTSPESGWPPAAQMLLLGGLFVVTCAVVYSGVALLARFVLVSRPRSAAVVAKVSGAAMTAIGVALLIERGVMLLPGH